MCVCEKFVPAIDMVTHTRTCDSLHQGPEESEDVCVCVCVCVCVGARAVTGSVPQ